MYIYIFYWFRTKEYFRKLTLENYNSFRISREKSRYISIYIIKMWIGVNRPVLAPEEPLYNFETTCFPETDDPPPPFLSPPPPPPPMETSDFNGRINERVASVRQDPLTRTGPLPPPYFPQKWVYASGHPFTHTHTLAYARVIACSSCGGRF